MWVSIGYVCSLVCNDNELQVLFPGLDKSRTCVHDILEMKHFTKCSILSFFNKYTHEHTFSVSWVRKATLRNWAYMYFKIICPSDS